MRNYWIFNHYNMHSINPFDKGLLSADSTPMRTDVQGVSFDLKEIIKWNGAGIYTSRVVNASFELHFLNRPISFSKYRIKSLANNCCSPKGLLLEGSFNGRDYETIHYINDFLCDASICSEKVEKQYKVNQSLYKHVRMVQAGGECECAFGASAFFGLTAIDFYIHDFSAQCTIKCMNSQTRLYMFISIILSH